MRKFKKFNKKDKSATTDNVKRKSVRDRILIIILGVGITALMGIIAVVMYIVVTAPEFDPDNLYHKESSIIFDKNGTEVAKIGAENREKTTYDELPQVLVDAIVATEDSRFFNHGGFDLPRFIKASFGQLIGDSSAGGASTITMQVSKNNYTSPDVSVIRKLTDIYMAIFKIEKVYTKEEIIEFYVNYPWLTTRSWGVEQTSQTLFGKSVGDLNLPEAALIAGLFQSPKYYNPFVYPENATTRRDTVLNLMVRHGYITNEEAENAKKIPVESMLTTTSNVTESEYQGFIDTVVDEIFQKTGHDAYNVPMNIYTTMDRTAQDEVNKVMNGESSHKWVNDTVQAGITITSVTDGSIAAIGNGRNKSGAKSLNLATKTNRHPGSTAKPVMAYGPLIEYENASTYTPFWDEPTTYTTGQRVNNVDSRFNGMMTLRTALSRSRNTAAVQAIQRLDKKKVLDFATSLGLKFTTDIYESYAIGSFETDTLSMSAAYASFARGGYYIEPYAFTKIEFKENGETITQKPKAVKVMSEETAYMINSVLMTATELGTAGRVNVSGTDISSKSGTSTYDDKIYDNYTYWKIPTSAARDGWLCVYSPDYSMTIWYGYEKDEPGQYFTGGAADTARKSIGTPIVNSVFPKNSKFDVPSGIVQVEIETETVPAALPSPNTPSNMRVTEYFRKGTEPTEISPRFQALENPKNGTASNSGVQINLSWNKINNPDAIDVDKLRTYFTDNYDNRFSDKYYSSRLAYNNAHIGTIGYQIYLKDAAGNLTNLGWTANNIYSYPNPGSGYSFVIKSSYSIYKTNMSSGIEIKIEGSGGSTLPITSIDANDTTISVGTGTYIENGTTQNPYGIKIWSGTTDITKSAGMSITVTYKDAANTTLPSGINKATPGNYKIVYSITYLGNTRTVERNYRIT